MPNTSMLNASTLLRLSIAISACAFIVGCKNGNASPTTAPVASAELQSCHELDEGVAPTPEVVKAGLHFGPAFKTASKDAVTVETLLANPAAYDGKTVRVVGKVSNVCRNKGCWLTFGTKKGDDAVFIKFTDPASGTLVPVAAVDHEIIAEGTFKVSQISEGFAKHLIEEGGGDPAEADKVVGPQKKFILAGAGVTIVDLK